jgi:hypothetical protein
MKVLPRFEANLLRILHYFLQQVPAAQAVPLLIERCPRPPCLSRVGVELVQDTLAKGCMLLLARGGAWRRARHLRGDQIVEGRLWDRTPPAELGLVFTQETLRFLIWITAAKPGDNKPRWAPAAQRLSVGDLVLFYLAYSRLRGTEVGPGIHDRFPFAGNGLCRLAYPEDFADLRNCPQVSFAPWTSGAGAGILEAVQPALARRWVHAERGKGEIRDWQRLRAVGTAQEAVLNQFLPALDQAGRPDLARFLLQAGTEVLTEDATPELWIGSLAAIPGMRLADRVETHRAALAFLRIMEVFRQWERRARGVGYFDEGYAAAQLWKAEWERWSGEVLHSRAQAILRQLDPLTFSSGGTSS